MRVLVCASGSYGDVYPFIGLGRELRARGHEVVFLANDHFRPAARAERLGFVAVGDAAVYDAAVHDPDLWHPLRGLRLVMDLCMRYVPASYESLREHYRPGETVVVASSLAFAARLLQETHAAPLVSVHVSPCVFRSVRDDVVLPFATFPARAPRWLHRAFWAIVDRAVIDPLLAPRLNEYRRTLGLAPVRQVFGRWLHSPDRVVGLFPEWFATPRGDWPANTALTGFPLYDAAGHRPVPDAARAFLDAGPAPVLFAPGTANPSAHEFFRASLEGCERAGRRALLVTGYPEQIPDGLPDWAAHFDYLPFSGVLDRVAAFVHHGGIGTLSQGLRAGVPQIVRPFAFDQFDNAARAERLGVSLTIGASHYAPARLAATLARLDSGARRAACAAVARRFEAPPATAGTADLVEALAAAD